MTNTTNEPNHWQIQLTVSNHLANNSKQLWTKTIQQLHIVANLSSINPLYYLLDERNKKKSANPTTRLQEKQPSLFKLTQPPNVNLPSKGRHESDISIFKKKLWCSLFSLSSISEYLKTIIYTGFCFDP